jgi:PXPV repeat-containing protein
MERTGKRITETSIHAPRRARRLRAGLLLLGGALALGGCFVVPVQPAYVAPGPVYVAPAPVYVAPAPVYVAPAPVYYWGGYGWRRHGRW